MRGGAVPGAGGWSSKGWFSDRAARPESPVASHGWYAMTAVMFAGPSLWDMRGKIPEGITVLPPAQCGDLLAAWRNGATRIGLVDGLFGTCRSVWHKEILAVLAAGVPVLGAASLGALRAAECAPFGMQ